MSSAKSKKKSKSSMIPKPMKIKKEDDHIIYPMEHYVDDRVELIRQIFASLKPKTITNLAPEFLKERKLEDIQEQCLNEILGISRKRLISIINSTKCPTDTETSEEEVQSVDEHISLEEISSDSDIAEHKGTKLLKGKKKLKVKGANDNGNNKQFSVLELLELQARARAIRSQLALEPVTKIEVDTDSELEEPAATKKAPPSRKKSDKATTNGRPSAGKSDAPKRPASATVTTAEPNGEPASTATTKRIKLKRNFRKQTHDTDSNDEAKKTEKSTEPVEKVEPKTEARSPSPDVIPIIAVPETLCISDSEEDVEKKVEDRSKAAESSELLQILSVVNIEAPKMATDRTESNDQVTNDSPKQITPAEAEEGEIVEEDDRLKADPKTEDTAKTDGNKSVSNKTHDIESAKESQEATNGKEKEQKKEQTPDASESKTESAVSSESEDDSNDDVISLEGGDLLNEMKEHMDDDGEELIVTTPAEEVICLEDSSEEETKPIRGSESWNQRWLQSSKVSRVLATSRLGNRVRNKIKESKKAKKLEEEAIIEAEQAKPQEVIFTSKHADGSVDQYKELLENVQK